MLTFKKNLLNFNIFPLKIGAGNAEMQNTEINKHKQINFDNYFIKLSSIP